MLKASDSDYIMDVLSAENNYNRLKLEIKHTNEIDRSENKIEIYMNALPMNNPMINFLKDVKEHSKLFTKY